MIDYTQSFDEFASSLKPTDLALYAGVAIVLWILFKDKLNPLTSTISKGVNQLKELLGKKDVSVAPSVETNEISFPIHIKDKEKNKEDIFFELVVSWKKTRDLAVLSGCEEAVKVADQMFPFLSPNICNQVKTNVSSRFVSKDNA